MSSTNDKNKQKISLIISTFNRPKALRAVLECLKKQDDRDFEVIIADDGSGISTRETIKEFSNKNLEFKIKHVWQENRGFRLAKIRNLAVLASTGDYLIFLDGDCIPPPNFISKHRELSEKGWSVFGQRILTNQSYANYIENQYTTLLSKKYWTIQNFALLCNNKSINRITPAINLPGNLWRKIGSKRWDKIRGCNWAMWKEDYLSINGSDESFEGWGAEDKDVCVRLINNGILIKDGRFSSYVLHLWHEKASKLKDEEHRRLILERWINKEIYPFIGIFKKSRS